jgi:hypothetical protein
VRRQRPYGAVHLGLAAGRHLDQLLLAPARHRWRALRVAGRERYQR